MVHPYSGRAVLFWSGVCLVCMMLVVLGMQSHPALVPMLERFGLVSIDAAVGFAAVGVGLMRCARGLRRQTLAAAALVLLLAILNLAMALGLPAISLLWLLDAWTTLPEGLRNPAMPNTALGLLLTGLLLPLALPAGGVRRVSLLGVGSVLLLCVAIVPVIGYVLALDFALYWPGFGEIAAASAVALALIGMVTFSIAVSANPRLNGRGAALWPSLALGLGAIVLSGFISLALVNAQTDFVKQIVQSGADSIAREIENQLENHTNDQRRVVSLLEQGGIDVEPALFADAGALFFREGYRGLAWLDSALRIQFILPLAGVEPLLDPAMLRQSASHQAVIEGVREGVHVVSTPVPVSQAEAGFYIFMPVVRNAAPQGVLAVAYGIADTLDPVLTVFAERGLSLDIREGQDVLYRKVAGQALVQEELVEQVVAIGPGWRLAVQPTEALVQRYRNRLPETVLLLGSVLGLLAAFSLHTRKMLFRSHRHVHELNELLERKVQRRTAALLREVTAGERYAAKLAHAAKHDSLTDLPNRRLFAEHLIHGVADARRVGGTLVVMFIDLDNFKEINDSFGHAAGDDLLRQVARRMRYSLRQADVVARQGGDEFLVLADTLAQPIHASALATKVLLALNRGFSLGEQTVHVAVSIGLAIFPGEDYQGSDEEVASALIQNADTAMYQAKKNGKNRFEFHSRELQARIQSRQELKAALGKALNEEQLEVYYQPRIALHDRQLVGAEALLRWSRPGKGWISPDTFIPIAEDTGMIVELGSWVMDRVCRDLLHWQRRGQALPLISINASIHQFRDQQILLDLRQRLRQWPSLQKHLELELTEQVWIDERLEYRQLLREISRLGVRIAMDNFGTGCSSLRYFSRFPIDALKIDKTLIKHLMTNREDAMIARSVIDLGRNFELTVVAEGVETEAQFRRLRDYGCHEGQGYLFARALPADDFIACWHQGLSVANKR